MKVNEGNVVDECEYQCPGYNSTWSDKIYMVNHNVKNMNVFFCLNCSDWIRNKEAVLMKIGPYLMRQDILNKMFDKEKI